MSHSNQLDLSTLTSKQLVNLLWELRGTPAAQPLYRELSSRPKKVSIAPDDPDWDAKMDQALREALCLRQTPVNGLTDQHKNNQEVAQ